MSKSTWLAHVSEDGRQQTVLEHLQGTARRSASHAGNFGAGEQGELTGLTHDLGKYTAAFQRRLLDQGPKVDHSTAGAFECMKRGQPFAAFAVAGHHGGLPDGGGRGDGPGAGTFWSRINRAMAGGLEDYGAWQSELSLPDAARPEYAVRDKLEGMFFTRMLFSCLVDADYADTGQFMNGSGRDAAGTDSIDELWTRLQAHIAGWFPPKGALNARRCAILETCIREGKRRAPDLYTLTVPTGGGKTVSSLAFGLVQAKEWGLKRVVYVVPYTSIIEQTAQTFREILGDGNVLEHHSGISFDLEADEDTTPQTERFTRASETWDVPVVVTTAVQFFESLFSNRPSQARKLHNLAKSVLIFDEAQMLPLPCLRPCVWAITQLVRHYGACAVLCTATQPALDPIVRSFAPELSQEELCPMADADWEAFRRVTFRRAGRLDRDALAAQLQAHGQVLCIVNTRKAAREVFNRLQGEGNFHLSTLMYPAHRRAVLDEVRRRLREGQTCRVVSTSLIEAGVDVDFPALYREEAGLDSMLQAAGRCNREGRRAPEESAVVLFQGEGRPPRLFETAIDAGRMVLDRFADIASREAVRSYFEILRDLKGRDAQDIYGILPLMESEFFPFRTVAERFHLIDSPTVTVYIPEGKGAELVERLRGGEGGRNLYRSLGQYGVSVYESDLRALDRAGAVRRLEDGSYVLVELKDYSRATGLALDVSGGEAQFI